MIEGLVHSRDERIFSRDDRLPLLTDQERQAVERAAAYLAKAAESRGEIHSAGYLCDDAAMLRALLERLN